jgi:16S rRNA C1402 N4-methylase RsmH
MIDLLKRQTSLAKGLVLDVLSEGDSAVDATAGTGADTVFLANVVGENGRVYAFDNQWEAISKTAARLRAAGLTRRVSLFFRGHETMGDNEALRRDSGIKAFMFNLGYLPGGNHQKTTSAETTLTAIKSALKLLAPGGIITILAYMHPEGRQEYDALSLYLSTLLNPYDVYRVETVNHQNAPVLFVITKKEE